MSHPANTQASEIAHAYFEAQNSHDTERLMVHFKTQLWHPQFRARHYPKHSHQVSYPFPI